MRALVRSVLLSALGAAALLPQTASAAVTRVSVDGPSADLAFDGSSQVAADVAPDGTGAIVYRKTVGGQPHVFVAEYRDGAVSPAVRIDPALPTPSGPPAVSVGNGGRIVVAFPNGPSNNASLYAVVKSSSAGAFGNPAIVSPSPGVGLSWASPAVDLAPNGTGYLVAHRLANVFAFRFDGAAFSPVGAVLNGDPAAQADPTLQYRARVAADATGGSAVIAWSETDAAGGPGDHIVWARKLTGTTAGAARNLRVTSFNGHTGSGSANDDISVAAGGGTTWVAFHAAFDVGGGSLKAHGIVRTFDGTTAGPPQRIDGIADGPGQTPDNNAEFPVIALNSSGRGLGASYLGLDPPGLGAQGSVLTNGTWSLGTLVTSDPEKGAAAALPAIDDNGAGLISVYNTPPVGDAQVLSRIYGGTSDGAVQKLSDPAFGPVQLGFAAAAGGGKALTAFMQGAAGTSRIVATVVDLPVPVATPTPTTTPAPGPGVTPTPKATPPNPPTPLTLTGLTFRKGSFAQGRTAPAIVSATSPKRALSFTLGRAATVTLTVAKQGTGRTSKGKCVAQTSKNRKAKACRRLLPVKGSAVIKAPAGTTNLSFTGALTGGKQLATGKYTLTATARDAAGIAAAPASASFTLTAAKKSTKK